PGAAFFAAAVYLLTAWVFHHIFIVHERDRKIYGKYEERWDRNPRKRRDLLISVFVIAAPYLLLALLSLFFPRQA
ncbi:MAG: hypothetical protein ABUL46_02065, partial [Chitinophaga rupis]